MTLNRWCDRQVPVAHTHNRAARSIKKRIFRLITAAVAEKIEKPRISRARRVVAAHDAVAGTLEVERRISAAAVASTAFILAATLAAAVTTTTAAAALAAFRGERPTGSTHRYRAKNGQEAVHPSKISDSHIVRPVASDLR
jgi:hypothetical protein